MTGHLSLLLINLQTNLLAPRHCQDGPMIYLVWLVLMSLPLSRTQPGLQHLYSTANLSIVYKSASWRIGPPPAEFIKNFTRNICKDDVYPFILSPIYCIDFDTFCFIIIHYLGVSSLPQGCSLWQIGFVNFDIPALHSGSY